MSIQREFQFAISYAGPDQPFVEKVVAAMKARGLRVFYAPDEQADILGRNLIDYLSEVYLSKAEYCLVFISRHYAERKYPDRVERPAAQSRAINQKERYIIPVRLDDAKIPGMLETIAEIRSSDPKQIADLCVAILLRDESPASVFRGGGARDHLTLRVLSFTELDVDLLRSSFKAFQGFSTMNTHQIPVELRLPDFFIQALNSYEVITQSDEFKQHDDETRKGFSKIIPMIRTELFGQLNRAPAWVLNAAQPFGAHSLILSDQSVELIRRFVLAKIIAAARCLVSYQLKGFPGLPWASQFADCKPLWVPGLMGGLPWLCRAEGSEPHLWLDADIYGWGSGVSFNRVRISLPSVMVIKHLRAKPTPDEVLRFVCPQLLERELDGQKPFLLPDAFRSPDQMHLSKRNENVIESHHFNEVHLSNFNWKEALPAIESLRDEILENHKTGKLSALDAITAMHRAQSALQHEEVFVPAIRDLYTALDKEQSIKTGGTPPKK